MFYRIHSVNPLRNKHLLVCFLDDTVNQRILIYKNGKYEKSISLEWNYDVKRMYYSATDHILKTVYEDLSYSIRFVLMRGIWCYLE